MFEPQTAYSTPVSSPHQTVLKPGTSHSGWLTRWMRLDESEASFSVRRFHASSEHAQRRLELIGRTFITGYNSAIENKALDETLAAVEEVDGELRGFAFEGAAMACSLLDVLSLRSPWFTRLIQERGQQYIHLCWVGTGWACARLKLLHGRFRRKFFYLEPLLSTLAYDGWGFHEGYFFSSRYLSGCRPAPALLKGYTRHVFDQGFGRSLWFVGGASPAAIKSMVSRYSVERQADMWSGVGLACAYAGGTDRPGLEAMLTIGPGLLPHLQQGVAFAAKARVHSGNVTDDTALAARVFCSSTPQQLAEVTDAAQQRTSDYNEWRNDIQRYFI